MINNNDNSNNSSNHNFSEYGRSPFVPPRSPPLFPLIPSTGDHTLCSKECQGAEDFVMDADDPDGEMLRAGVVAGGDFFEAATQGEDESVEEGGNGGGGGGQDSDAGEYDSGGVSTEAPAGGGWEDATGDGKGPVDHRPSANAGRSTPKLTLTGCDRSAETAPSMRRTMGVSKELFGMKSDGWRAALLATKASKEASVEGEAERGTEEDEVGVGGLYETLEGYIGSILKICSRARGIVDETLSALDDAVREALPVRLHVVYLFGT